MVNYELRLRGGFDKGAVIAVIDGLRECFQETGVPATVYSQDKKRGIIRVEDIERREVLDSALGKHAPSGLKYDVLELDEATVPKEHMAALYEMQRRLDEAESEKDKAHAELREANKRTEQEVRARQALVEIKERLQKESEEQRRSKEVAGTRYEELFKEFDRLATTRADPKDAGITKVLNFASDVKRYDDRFDDAFKDAVASVEEMLKVGGMSLEQYANSILSSRGVSVATEQELDALGSPPQKSETDEYATAKEELRFLEDLAAEKISGIPKHLIPTFTSAIDRNKDEEVVKLYETRLSASGEAMKIRKTYDKAAGVKSAAEAIRKEGARIPYFITNGEDGDIIQLKYSPHMALRTARSRD